MTEDQLSCLWAFARGETPGADFEQWFFQQSGLEGSLGEELHFNLLSSDYRDSEQVRKLRLALDAMLATFRQCECPTIRDESAIPMGSDFYFEKVFETLDEVISYGPEKWWLYISRCSKCGTNWLVAQDDRIYDDFFMKRLTDEQIARAKAGRWPDQFQTYENVLSTGRKVSTPPVFFDPMSHGLVCTAQDLLCERPDMPASHIAYLLGLQDGHAERLVERARAESI